MDKHLATYDPATGKITGFYDLTVSEYSSIDFTYSVQVPDDIWDNNLDKPLIVRDGVLSIVVPEPPALADLVRQAKLDLASIRYRHEVAGTSFTMPSDGTSHIVASDRESQSKLIAAFVLASMSPTRWKDGNAWKMLDGSFVPLMAEDAVVMSLTVQGYVSACFTHEAALLTEIDAATDAASLDAIDLTVGWP